MNPENLQAFCGNDEYRLHLNEPGNYHDDILCSNGHIGIVFTNHSLKTDNNFTKEVIRCFDNFVKTTFGQPITIADIPSIPCSKCGGDKVSTCNECHGDGFVSLETSYNDYEVDCKSCDAGTNNECCACNGTGSANTSVTIEGVFINYHYIDLCKKNLNNPTFSIPDGETKIIRIDHDDGYGFLMPQTGPCDRDFELTPSGEILAA